MTNKTISTYLDTNGKEVDEKDAAWKIEATYDEHGIRLSENYRPYVKYKTPDGKVVLESELDDTTADAEEGE